MYFKEICHLLDEAIKEDVRSGDITSKACVGANDVAEGVFILKQEGVVAGLPFLAEIFSKVDSSIKVDLLVDEGDSCIAGTNLAIVYGNARGIFSAERTALNFLQHASGIATKTAEFVGELDGFDCDILDTRNTIPGLRCLERYAVKIGGGKNHRNGLDEWFVIKHSHLKFLSQIADRPIIEAVKRVREYSSNVAVEVQIYNLKHLEDVIESRPDIILLDQMPIQDIGRAVRSINKVSYVEATGDICLDSVMSYAETGVDGLSIPDLTHSVQGLDIRLRFNNKR